MSASSARSQTDHDVNQGISPQRKRRSKSKPFFEYEVAQVQKYLSEFHTRVASTAFIESQKPIRIPPSGHVQGGVQLPTRERRVDCPSACSGSDEPGGEHGQCAAGCPESSEELNDLRDDFIHSDFRDFWKRQSAHISTILAALQKVYHVNVAMVTMINSVSQLQVCEMGFGLLEIPRCESFCAWLMENKYTRDGCAFDVADLDADPSDASLMLIGDASQQEVFMHNPLVLGPPHIRLYAGVPLITQDKDNQNFCFGSLCILHDEPRASFCPEMLIEAGATIMRMMRPAADLYRIEPSSRHSSAGSQTTERQSRRRKTIGQLRASGHFNIHRERIVLGHDKRTCVMITGIPNRFTSQRVQMHLLEIGIPPYDYFFLPSGVRSSNRGNAFINFLHAQSVLQFLTLVQGKTWPNYSGTKTVTVSYSNLQGFSTLRNKLGDGTSVLDANFMPKISREMFTRLELLRHQVPEPAADRPDHLQVMKRIQGASSSLDLPKMTDFNHEAGADRRAELATTKLSFTAEDVGNDARPFEITVVNGNAGPVGVQSAQRQDPSSQHTGRFPAASSSCISAKQSQQHTVQNPYYHALETPLQQTQVLTMLPQPPGLAEPNQPSMSADYTRPPSYEPISQRQPIRPPSIRGQPSADRSLLPMTARPSRPHGPQYDLMQPHVQQRSTQPTQVSGPSSILQRFRAPAAAPSPQVAAIQKEEAEASDAVRLAMEQLRQAEAALSAARLERARLEPVRVSKGKSSSSSNRLSSADSSDISCGRAYTSGSDGDAFDRVNEWASFPFFTA